MDFCVRLSEMGNTNTEILQVERKETAVVPDDVRQEAEIAERVLVSLVKVPARGKTIYACPDS